MKNKLRSTGRTALLVLSMLAIVGTVFIVPFIDAEASRAPFFNRETVERFQALENDGRLLKLPFNFTATNFTSGGSTQVLTGSVPADSFIIGLSAIVETDIVSANSNTLALGCESTDDLDAAFNFDPEAVNSVQPGTPRPNDEATWVYTATGCTPTMLLGAGASGITAGRIMYHLEFRRVETNNTNP